MGRSRRRLVAPALALVAGLMVTSACSVGEIGGEPGGAASGQTEIRFLTQNEAANIAVGEALIEAYAKVNPNVKITMETQPGGTDGDNLTKTKLATGEMADVFTYNAGSLLQAINPDQNLVDRSDAPWVSALSEDFKRVVSTDTGLYGAPTGTTSAGAMLYNIPVYEELGLSVPTSWAELEANLQKIKAAGKVAPVQQTYADSWTAQLFVLGDFGNVAAQDPQWAEQYTANQRKFTTEPALQGFANQQRLADLGMFNRDFASAKYDDGVKAVATGTAAHYPMLTSAVGAITQNYADNINDVGVFPLPAQDAADTRLTVWMPGGFYIPKTTEGDKLEAAKGFVDYIASAEGCAVLAETVSVAGPFPNSNCALPDDVPQMVKDMQPYLDGGKSGLALEFVSPVKGPNLSQITVEVGSKVRDAKSGAALYDEDVKKQAQQLGLPGW